MTYPNETPRTSRGVSGYREERTEGGVMATRKTACSSQDLDRYEPLLTAQIGC